MKQSKIKLSLSKLNDGQLEDLALGVSSAMTNNSNFPEPAPALADLNSSIKLFSDALAIARNGDRAKIAAKNEFREELEFLLVELANYCTHIAKGTRSILATSGFTLATEARLPITLGDPQNFTVQLGKNSGEVFLSINSLTGAKGYMFFYGTTPIQGDSWVHTANSQPSMVITGLIPTATYSFKIGVIGPKGQRVYTDIVSKMIV